jgi:hypothetical protein
MGRGTRTERRARLSSFVSLPCLAWVRKRKGARRVCASPSACAGSPRWTKDDGQLAGEDDSNP